MFPLHTAPAVPRTFWATWSLEPLPIILIFGAAALYAAGLRAAHSRGRKAQSMWSIAAFYVGLAAMALAMLGPLDAYADDSFFIHMLQHLVLLVAAAPLLLLGRPVQLGVRAFSPNTVRKVSGVIGTSGPLRAIGDVLSSPWLVFTAYNANLVLWHLPRAYEAALENDLVHELEHGLFFSTALLFWWIVIDPHPRHHKASSHAVFGLSITTCFVGNVLAAALTLSPTIFYGWYAVRDANPWGWSPLADQQLGGAIMWIGGLVYFGVLFVLLARDNAANEANVTIGNRSGSE